MRRPIIAGNWKMNMAAAQEAVALVAQLRASVNGMPVDVVVCPPFPWLASVAQSLSNSSIALGAQDLFWEPQGAFTGEVSPTMLAGVGCRYVIVGHSERRQLFGETDANVNKKLQAALRYGLTPIVCVGETLAQRERNETAAVVREQVRDGLASLSEQDLGKIVLAYEPVWAIGTGRTATPEQAQEVHALIRRLVQERWGGAAAQGIRVQYGGSVTAANALELLRQPDVDGALVGGASLKADAFAAIIQAAAQAKGVTA